MTRGRLPQASPEARKNFLILLVHNHDEITSEEFKKITGSGYGLSQIRKQVTLDTLMKACAKLFPDLTIKNEEDLARFALEITEKNPQILEQIHKAKLTTNCVTDEMRRAFIIMYYNRFSDMSQEDIATMAGCSSPVITQIIHGNAVSVEMFEKIIERAFAIRPVPYISLTQSLLEQVKSMPVPNADQCLERIGYSPSYNHFKRYLDDYTPMKRRAGGDEDPRL